MPLLLLDLDNTLIDRAAAFARWAVTFAGAAGAPAEAGWLIAADRDGLEPRHQLAAAIRERFGLTSRDGADLVAEMRHGMVANIVVDRAVPAALDQARAAGWVVSEGVGVRKPDPAIFQLAADLVGLDLDGAWMIGDSAEADIGGACGAGIASIWLHRDRSWTTREFAPTRIMSCCAEAIASLGP